MPRSLRFVLVPPATFALAIGTERLLSRAAGGLVNEIATSTGRISVAVGFGSEVGVGFAAATVFALGVALILRLRGSEIAPFVLTSAVVGSMATPLSVALQVASLDRPAISWAFLVVLLGLVQASIFSERDRAVAWFTCVAASLASAGLFDPNTGRVWLTDDPPGIAFSGLLFTFGSGFLGWFFDHRRSATRRMPTRMMLAVSSGAVLLILTSVGVIIYRVRHPPYL